MKFYKTLFIGTITTLLSQLSFADSADEIKFNSVCYDSSNVSLAHVERLKSYFEITIIEGVKRLEAINPKLADLFVKNFNSQPLLVDDYQCAAHIERGSFESASKETPNKICIGENRTILISDEQAHNKPYPLNYDERSRKALIDTDVRAVIFHESLHFTHIENHSLKKHNNPGRKQSRDLVYSCAYSVYPSILETENPEESLKMCKNYCSSIQSTFIKVKDFRPIFQNDVLGKNMRPIICAIKRQLFCINFV